MINKSYVFSRLRFGCQILANGLEGIVYQGIGKRRADFPLVKEGDEDLERTRRRILSRGCEHLALVGHVRGAQTQCETLTFRVELKSCNACCRRYADCTSLFSSGPNNHVYNRLFSDKSRLSTTPMAAFMSIVASSGFARLMAALSIRIVCSNISKALLRTKRLSSSRAAAKALIIKPMSRPTITVMSRTIIVTERRCTYLSLTFVGV